MGIGVETAHYSTATTNGEMHMTGEFSQDGMEVIPRAHSDHGETRAFFRDPNVHLFEISEV